MLGSYGRVGNVMPSEAGPSIADLAEQNVHNIPNPVNLEGVPKG